MRILRIKKKSGAYRTIYAPDKERKAQCRALLPAIERAAREADKHGVQHGFTEGRSPVTNALVHVGWMYTLTMDMASWFDTVTPDHVLKAERADVWRYGTWDYFKKTCFEDGAARQGLPTSPTIANLAAAPMDAEIMACLLYTSPSPRDA